MNSGQLVTLGQVSSPGVTYLGVWSDVCCYSHEFSIDSGQLLKVGYPRKTFCCLAVVTFLYVNRT